MPVNNGALKARSFCRYNCVRARAWTTVGRTTIQLLTQRYAPKYRYAADGSFDASHPAARTLDEPPNTLVNDAAFSTLTIGYARAFSVHTMTPDMNDDATTDAPAALRIVTKFVRLGRMPLVCHPDMGSWFTPGTRAHLAPTCYPYDILPAGQLRRWWMIWRALPCGSRDFPYLMRCAACGGTIPRLSGLCRHTIANSYLTAVPAL